MPLAKGHKLGPYEIESQAGSGGMGEVYRARDTRLDRTVAIKVLPERSSWHPDAKARFEREAKTISSLNHPNICTLHDVGQQDCVDYLVMEYLEGETLEDRLKKGKLDSAEALTIGSQIAAALDAAHRKGLVHRDLKPGNIFLTKDGAKLLDFGLAKLRADTVQGLDAETHSTPVTGAGAIVGTLQYMSPEQLEGHEAGPRSDIFAFGATLYEMVTGARPFSGASKASLIGSIMKEHPPAISELIPTTPPALDRLIKKCLQKDPDDRWQSAKDLKDELDWIAAAGSQAGIAAPLTRKRHFRLRLAWIIASLTTVAATLLGTLWFTRDIPETPTMRFSIPRPAGVARIEWPQISPDGRSLAFLGYDTAGVSQVWMRPLNAEQAFPLPGTKNTYRPFWSPDSRFLAFFDEDLRQIMKVPVSGGQPQLVCKAKGADGTWGNENVILFDDYQGNSIGQVPATGGEPRLAVAPDTSMEEVNVAWPYFLPDGRHFIYTAYLSSLRGRGAARLLKVASIEGGVTKTIGPVGSQAIFCSPRYLLYMNEDYLVAHPFDVEALEFLGDPIPLADSFTFVSGTAAGINVSASNTGMLVLQTGAASGNQRLVWVDREGRELDTIGRNADYRNLQISNDDSRIGCTIATRGEAQLILEIYDTKARSIAAVVQGDAFNSYPVWSPDNESFAYVTSRWRTATHIKYQDISGTSGVVKALPAVRSALLQKWVEATKLWYCDYPTSVPAESDTETYHLLSIDITDTSKVDTLLRYFGWQVPYRISPDNRYLLMGDYSGLDWGMYVYDLNEPGRRWRLPITGTEALWSPLGNEIFYFENNDFMALDIDLTADFYFGTTKKLFTRDHIPVSDSRAVLWGYDVSSDAQRFLFITPMRTDSDRSDDIQVLLNWHTDLENK